MKFNIFTIGFLFLILVGFMNSAAGERLSVQAGATVFADPQNPDSAYVEFPFTVNRGQFEFRKMEGEDWYRAAVLAELVVSDTFDVPIDTARTFFYTRVDDSVEIARKDIKLFNKLAMMIKPGVYKAKLTVVDAIDKSSGSFLYNRIEIEEVETKSLSLSNIELAYRIDIVDTATIGGPSRMIKNGRQILSSPMGIFSEADSNVFVYAELYNLDFTEGSEDSFNIGFKAYDDQGDLYFDYGSVTLVKPGSSAVISNVLDVKDWAPGKYKLNVTAIDNTTEDTVTRAQQVIIFPKSGTLSTAVAYEYRSPLDTASSETLAHILKYVADPDDLLIFEKLNEAGKMRFAKQFFSDNDPTPATDRNEYLEDVFNRFIYSNEQFSSYPGANDGWRTDRGRILMQYGRPNDISDAMAPAYANPWQIWHYYQIQGGVYFVFEDQEGYGDFRMVHSNADGEKFDPQWEAKIKGLGEVDKYLGE